MKRSALLALACLVAAAVGAQDLNHIPLENWYPDGLHVNTATAITGTWTAVAGSPIIVRASGSAAVESEVAVGADITIGGYGYRVAARADGTADADTITITPTRDPATGQRRPGATASATGQVVYLIGLGLSATAAEVEDGAGTGSGVWLDNAGNLTAEATIHAGRDDDTGDVEIHNAGILTLRDRSDDTAVVIGPVGKDTTVAAVTGTLNADGLQVGGAPVLTAEVDGVVGNEVTAATDATLTRSGAGTAGDPYTLGLNLTNSNTWTAVQTTTWSSANTSAVYRVVADTYNPGTEEIGSIIMPVGVTFRGSTDSGGTWITIPTSGYLGWELYKVADCWSANLADCNAGWRLYTANNGIRSLGLTISNTGIISAASTVQAGGSGHLYSPTNVRIAGVAAAETANRIVIGNDMVMVEGSTTDALQHEISWPTYSNTNDGLVQDRFAVQTTTSATLGAGVVVKSGGLTGQAYVGSRIQSIVFDYTDIATAVGAATTGTYALYTLPAGAILEGAWLVVGVQGVSADATYTMTIGTAAATYDQVLVGSDVPTAMNLKAAVNTLYGDVADEWGTDLPDVDYTAGSHLYSITATQALTAYVDCGAINCNAAGITAGQWTLTVQYALAP